MTEMQETEIRKAVKEKYARLATSRASESCCGPECCGESTLISIGENIPKEASAVNAGCGSPLSLIAPKEGDSVLDLGSGGGIDVFRASALVGESGRAIGVDATPEMVWRARETAKSYGDKYRNVEFRLGEIENLPIPSNSVDYVISNCVINLSPNKKKVFGEVFRVLRAGGVFAVADITTEDEIPDSSRKDLDSWSECVSGAISTSEYRKLLASEGFVDISFQGPSSEDSDSRNDSGTKEFPFRTMSNHIKARKPSGFVMK